MLHNKCYLSYFLLNSFFERTPRMDFHGIGEAFLICRLGDETPIWSAFGFVSINSGFMNPSATPDKNHKIPGVLV